MAQTHPNAFRLEALDKRAQANGLNGEADTLDARARELETEMGLPHPADDPAAPKAPKKAPAKKAGSVNRSSKSGKFVSKSDVKKSPDTTETEAVGAKPKASSPKDVKEQPVAARVQTKQQENAPPNAKQKGAK